MKVKKIGYKYHFGAGKCCRLGGEGGEDNLLFLTEHFSVNITHFETDTYFLHFNIFHKTFCREFHIKFKI